MFAEAGMTKDDVRKRLAATAMAPAWLLEAGFQGLGHGRADFGERVRSGRLPAAYARSDDPARLVPVIPDPASLIIIVAGNAGRCQAKYYLPVGQPGRFSSRAVVTRVPLPTS